MDEERREEEGTRVQKKQNIKYDWCCKVPGDADSPVPKRTKSKVNTGFRTTQGLEVV